MKKNASIAWMMFLGYLVLLFYFNTIDTYHRHFFSTGYSVFIYNSARLFFIASLIWLFYSIGDRVLTYSVGGRYASTDATESSLLAFFAGVGIYQIVLFFFGLSGWYERSIMMAMTVGLFALSLPQLSRCLYLFRSHAAASLYWPGILIFLASAALFLMIKGLYPAGGHDYYTHYFQFYKHVIESGSIWPNEVWYHFYYSKGAGLFFFSMLLTDPLAPQLASSALILAGAVIVFSILRQATSWRLFPWIGASLYLLFLVYTPGPFENLRQGGWGDLEKPHEPAAVLMLAVIWLTSRLTQTHQLRQYGIALLLTVSGLVLFSPVMAVIISGYLAMLFAFFVIKKQRAAAYWVGLGVATAITWLAFLWLLNYWMTGLPNDQNLLTFWPFINLAKINEWGVLFELIILHWAKTGLVANQVPMSMDMVMHILGYLRLDVWWHLFIVCVGLFMLRLALRQRDDVLSTQHRLLLCLFGLFLLFITVLSVFIGRDQPISYYRFTSFTYAPMLCFCLLLLASVLRHKSAAIICVAALGMSASLAYFVKVYPIANPSIQAGMQTVMGAYSPPKIKDVIHNGLKFMTGRFSIAEAYQTQQSWPGRMPWGGIYPPIETIWKQLPLNTRIWSMHIHSYCMLPGCNVQGYMSFRLSPHVESVFYGDPLEAKAWLKKDNLNYFFFSTALQLTDPLPLSPLFSPQHIAKYLGIAWTDGENTLLTWKEDAKFPIDQTWIRHYKELVDAAPVVTSFPYSAIQQVMKQAKAKNKLVSTDIPWNRAGWK